MTNESIVERSRFPALGERSGSQQNVRGMWCSRHLLAGDTFAIKNSRRGTGLHGCLVFNRAKEHFISAALRNRDTNGLRRSSLANAPPKLALMVRFACASLQILARQDLFCRLPASGPNLVRQTACS